jgi:predicted solute-binding protein
MKWKIKQGQKEEKRKNECSEHEWVSTGGHSNSTSDYLSFLYYTLEEVHDL